MNDHAFASELVTRLNNLMTRPDAAKLLREAFEKNGSLTSSQLQALINDLASANFLNSARIDPKFSTDKQKRLLSFVVVNPELEAQEQKHRQQLEEREAENKKRLEDKYAAQKQAQKEAASKKGKG